MNTLTEIQTINGPDGAPAYVVMPYAVYMRRFAHEAGLIPHEVVSAMVDGGASPIKAWREHLGMTQAAVAARMGVSPAAYARTESAAKPRSNMLVRVAQALGLNVEQLLH